MTPVLRIGCPVWACADWRGGLYTRAAERKDYLAQYSQVFDCVEGNSTFYALPSSSAVCRWRDETPESFRFCFKFPSEISHRAMLRNCASQTADFLQLMAPLGPRLGPFMLQLGPRFSAANLDVLRAYLKLLPGEFEYAVEVRHPDFFDQGVNEAALHELLREHSMDRCLFDTRCVHAGADNDSSTQQAQSRKPSLPLRTQAVGRRPMVRFVGQNQVEAADEYLDVWIDTVVRWLQTGLSPYFFTHTPDDRHAPELARRLHQRLRTDWAQLPEMAAFAGEQELAPAPAPQTQMSLF